MKEIFTAKSANFDFMIIVILAISLALIVSSCATNDPNRRAKTGAATGAAVGAVIGHQLDDSAGRYVGAAIGALAGAVVGHYMDDQQQAFEQELAEERDQQQLEIERMRDESLKLSLDSEVSFDFDSARIKPSFKPSLDKLAGVLRKYDRTVVHVIGHTDSTGAAAYNETLSKRRADSVAGFLGGQGVAHDRLRTEGRGEHEPRDSNASEAGRQLNRRVEIYLKPVVEGDERRAYESPRY